MTRSILVIGAGELGLQLIKAITSHPSKPIVSVLLRDSSKTDLSKYPVKVIRGDITASIDGISNLLKGYDIVISATGFSGGSGSQINLAKAALKAKIPHYFPWQFGVNYDLIGRGSSQPLFDEQLDVRDLLRSQNKTKWTIISTGLFTSFLFDKSFHVVDFESKRKDKIAIIKALGNWNNKLTITSAEEIGYLTSRIVFDEEENPPEGVVFIASDTITFEDVAKQVEKVGWSVEKQITTVDQLQDRLNKNSDDQGAKYGMIWARNVGVSWSLDDTWNGKNGVETESLDQWVNKNLARP
ncbi:uncharacterized protein L201_006460 [Kwoniella dendrophila CBS 6074]|uniref:NmrA-like domain-containing protein n=1 Tax=Kwoniella dendrophila CBS 6074 TaxID=1295534 RepID=A0AAX4K2A8_9TREE